MEPLRVVTHPARRIIGKSMQMSLAENKTPELFRSFMPERNRISTTSSNDFFAIQIYDGEVVFAPHVSFTKWAGMEVPTETIIPEGMSELFIDEGEYAVFLHEGPAFEFPRTLQGIMEWLAANGKQFDARPQFEILPADYPGPTSPEAKEEVWIPIRSID